MEIVVGLILLAFVILIGSAFVEELTSAVDVTIFFILCTVGRIQTWFEDHCK